VVPRVIHSKSTANGRLAQASDYASLGTDHQAATSARRVLEANTSAPYVAPVLTTPNNATLLHDLLVVKTPFIPDAWETMLNAIVPFNPFPDVPIGLRYGFDMGVYNPPIQTFTPPNHNSALSFPDHVMSHIHKELLFWPLFPFKTRIFNRPLLDLPSWYLKSRW
jgi:hypothetical protein